MTSLFSSQARLQRSARALKAYFENKLKREFELLGEAPRDARPGDVRFGAHLNRFGLWGLRAALPLNPAEHQEVFAMCDSVLSAIETMDERRALAEGVPLAEWLIPPSRAQAYPENVIPFRRPTPGRAPRVEDRRCTLRLDCLIESMHVSEIHKMALELHSNSTRYAFLDYRDITPEDRTSVDSLLALGNITVFIPDITRVTRVEQATLVEVMNFVSTHRPLIMAGTMQTLGELRDDPAMNDEFLSIVSRVYIKLTKSFQEYKEQGLIRYLLDSMSEDLD